MLSKVYPDIWVSIIRFLTPSTYKAFCLTCKELYFITKKSDYLSDICANTYIMLYTRYIPYIKYVEIDTEFIRYRKCHEKACLNFIWDDDNSCNTCINLRYNYFQVIDNNKNSIVKILVTGKMNFLYDEFIQFIKASRAKEVIFSGICDEKCEIPLPESCESLTLISKYTYAISCGIQVNEKLNRLTKLSTKNISPAVIENIVKYSPKLKTIVVL